VLGDSLEMRDKRTVQPTTWVSPDQNLTEGPGRLNFWLQRHRSVTRQRPISQHTPNWTKGSLIWVACLRAPDDQLATFDPQAAAQWGHRHTHSVGMTAHVVFRHEAVDLEGPLNLHDRRTTGQQMLTLNPECLQAAFLRSLDPDQRDRQGPSTARA
jgi:hypothetical protein